MTAVREPAEDAPVAEHLLALEGVDAGYGPFRALFGVSFTLAPGGAVAVLGPNGAGKTTLARVCTGLIQPSAGRVLFDGQDVAKVPAHRLAHLGVAHAPEGRSVFATLTVEENLALAFRRHLGRRGTKPALGRAYELFPRLGERRGQVAGTLSGGEQRMLALARVLVLRPRLLVADELSLGLSPAIVDDVYRTLRTIKAEGTAVMVIEQHVQHALELADEAVVLRKGVVAYAGPSSKVEDLGDQLVPDHVDRDLPNEQAP